jgi:hypothetical protein
MRDVTIPRDARALRLAMLGVTLLVLAPSAAAAQSGDPHEGAWRGGVLFDEDARDALRLDSHEDRETAATVSDALLTTALLGTMGDAIATPLALDHPQLAWQAPAGLALALGLSMFLGDVVKSAVLRARPFERECRATPDAPRCQRGDSFMSFYSLHTGMAFTAAGFACAMQSSRSLHGDPFADATACGMTLALAAATGLLRVASDRHYLTDVLVGAVLGFVMGYVVPLLVFPQGAATTPSALAEGDRVQALGSSVSIQFSGRF